MTKFYEISLTVLLAAIIAIESSGDPEGNFKTPVVTLSQHKTQGFWLFFYIGDLKEVIKARKEAMASTGIGEA